MKIQDIEKKFDEKFGKFQHKNETGLFNEIDYKQFYRTEITSLLESLKMEECNTEGYITKDGAVFGEGKNYIIKEINEKINNILNK